MPKRKRVRVAPIDDWIQLRLLCSWPEQQTDELIRPVVLFGQSPAERARQTGTSRRSVYRKAALFAQLGMAGLTAEPSAAVGRHLPDEGRQAILGLKAEDAAFGLREIAAICYVRFGRRPDHHTVHRVLADSPLPEKLTSRFQPDSETADPVPRRLAIIQLHTEGGSISSIAGYLQTSRPTVSATRKRWFAAVRRLQENPELGAFRIHAVMWTF
jgi:putative transposase